jgi:hypothetical protein
MGAHEGEKPCGEGEEKVMAEGRVNRQSSASRILFATLGVMVMMAQTGPVSTA